MKDWLYWTTSDIREERRNDILRLQSVAEMRPGQMYTFDHGSFYIMSPQDIERAASTIRNLEARWGL